MGWFDEQIRQRIQRDDDMFADAFAQMANLVSGERILSGLSDDRKLTEEAIGDILRYYHVRPQEVPEQLTDINDILEYLLRPSGIMRRTVKLSEGWYRDAVGAMLGAKKDGSIIALIPGGAGGYTCKDYATGKTVRINRKNADEISEDAICFYPPFPLRKLRIADLLSYCFRQLRARDYALMLLATLLITLLGQTVGALQFLTVEGAKDPESAQAILDMGVNLIDYDSTWTGENKNHIIEAWTGAINADKIQPKD